MSSIRPWYRRPGRVVPIAVAVVGVAAVAVSVLTPWPAALLIRAVFEQDGAKTVTEMQGHVPDVPLDSTLDVDTGLDAAEDLIRSTKHAIEQVELL